MKLHLILTLAILASTTVATRAVRESDLPELPNFDKRVALVGAKASQTPEQIAAAALAKTRIPDLEIDFDPTVGSPKWIYSRKGFVSRPTRHFLNRVPNSFMGPLPAPDRHEPAKKFLEEHRAIFGHGVDILHDAKITREFTAGDSGLRTVVWQQQLDGIPVFESILVAHTTQNKELVNLSSLFVPDLEQAAQMDRLARVAIAAAPPILAKEALANAANFIGEQVAILQAGGVTSRLGFGPEDGLANGDAIQLLLNACEGYATYIWNGSWSRTVPAPSKPWEPRPAIGEAFWMNPQGPRNWVRDFWVWP